MPVKCSVLFINGEERETTNRRPISALCISSSRTQTREPQNGATENGPYPKGPCAESWGTGPSLALRVAGEEPAADIRTKARQAKRQWAQRVRGHPAVGQGSGCLVQSVGPDCRTAPEARFMVSAQRSSCREDPRLMLGLRETELRTQSSCAMHEADRERGVPSRAANGVCIAESRLACGCFLVEGPPSSNGLVITEPPLKPRQLRIAEAKAPVEVTAPFRLSHVEMMRDALIWSSHMQVEGHEARPGHRTITDPRAK
jgi:hypothetical protein